MNDKLHDALNEISDKHLAEAENYTRHRRPLWAAAVAAVLALVIALSLIPIFRPDPLEPNMEGSTGVTTGTTRPTGTAVPPTFTTAPPYLRNLVAAPTYPEMVKIPSEYNSNFDEAYAAWRESYRAQYDQPKGYADSLDAFFYNSIRQFLSGETNAAYSPVSVYLAMAMLAETTDGNSRQQILDLFGLDTIEELRTQAGHLWNAHYSADGRSDLLLSNSLWLDEAYTFHRNTLDTLASHYYASSFYGDLGSQDMDETLRQWLNENTGELLYDQVQNVSLDPNTVFALASTVFFSAEWDSKFSEQNTRDDIFHSPNGDVTASFMNDTIWSGTYYWADHFSAIRLELTGDNYMWLILPDEGYTVADILSSDAYLQMTLDPNGWENRKFGIITHLSLPKFDVTTDNMDLIGGMQAMGVTDIFDPNISNFTPMTDTPWLYVSSIRHSARVAIDEDGCIGAAYTIITASGTGMPQDEVYFTLDRPFLFVVSSRDNLPIFVGSVIEP